jgi:arabinofuranan 3-O-arabinosyltransferase
VSRPRLTWLFLGALSYGPLLATRPGMVAADTKEYLYLDPGRLTTGAASMWDPNVGLGTVTHQNIGYLFPMGPYYWLVHALHVPYWVGQRVWMGTLLFAAGTGVLWCCRHLGLVGPGRVVAALAYTCTPYVIDYLARISAILMPWAALGWMLGLVILAVRRGGWRYPAVFALVLAVVGGVNATSILLAGLAPALWVVYAVIVTREVTARRALAAVGRLAVLGVAVSLWWIAGLWAEGSYGLSILQYTETVPTVARTSLSTEVLRGLGYWFFYGQDKVQPWTDASIPYMEALWLVAVSFLVPVVCLVAGALARWRYRAFAIGLVVVGTVAAVGTYPYDDPSPLGQVLKSASNGSSVGLAMRSSNRVLPVVVLGLALLLGSGVAALLASRPRLGWVAALVSSGLVLADIEPLWTGDMVAANLARPSQVPQYWQQAAGYLDAGGSATRVLGLPGEDFAAYRWGVTEDPVPPGLLTRPYAARQIVPQGEPGGVDLLGALDESIQDGVFDPGTLAPMARLMSAGQLLLQSDLQYERYSLPLPQVLWQPFAAGVPGLTAAATFGPAGPTGFIKYPLVNESQLGVPAGAAYPPALAVFDVPGARPIVRAESGAEPLLVAGDGAGVVDAAGAGLLAGNPTVFYSGSLDADPAGLTRVLGAGADLVVTDTNAEQGRRWGALQDNLGYVEQPGQAALVPDPSDQPLPLFPGAGASALTTASLQGVRSVRASAYGNPLTYTPEDRPSNAIDGDPSTAWTVAAFSDAVGQRWQVQLPAPVTSDHITLRQADGGNRTITAVSLRLDGGPARRVALGPASLSGAGQVVALSGSRPFSTVDMTIDSTTDDGGPRHLFDGLSGVGFSEVGIPGVNLHETIDLPSDLLQHAGAASAGHRLVYLMTRDRAPDVPPRHDPETVMDRTFSVPSARRFSVGGTARVSALDSDAAIDGLVGRAAGPAPGDPIVGADSSTRLPGDRAASADAAVDGNPATSWTAAFGPQAGEGITYDLARPLTFDHLDLQVVADGRRSLPTRITVSAGTGSRTVDVPPVAPGTGRPQGAVTPVRVDFPALSGTSVRITIDAARELTTLDYYGGQSGRQDVLPVALAEVGLPGAGTRPAPGAGAVIPSPCRSDLLSVDGRPVDIRVSGSAASALAGGGLSISPCGNSSRGVALAAGTHEVRTSPWLASGLQVDQLWLGSERGGAPLAATASGALPAPATAPAPSVRVTHQDRTHVTATVSAGSAGSPFWMVLGQSLSRGWTAQLDSGGRTVPLGAPQLIDGYANGWYVPAGALAAGGTAVVHLTWAPQRVVWVALVLSALALLACVGVVVAGGLARRRRRVAPGETDQVVPADPAAPVLAIPVAGGGTRPRWWVTAVAALGAGGVAGAVTAPWAAAPVALAVVLGCVVDRWRPVLALGPAGALTAAGVYMVAGQARHGYLPNILWPGSFHLANSLGWAAVCLLGADALVVLLRRRGAGAGPASPSPEEGPR